MTFSTYKNAFTQTIAENFATTGCPEEESNKSGRTFHQLPVFITNPKSQATQTTQTDNLQSERILIHRQLEALLQLRPLLHQALSSLPDQNIYRFVDPEMGVIEIKKSSSDFGNDFGIEFRRLNIPLNILSYTSDSIRRNGGAIIQYKDMEYSSNDLSQLVFSEPVIKRLEKLVEHLESLP